MKETKHFKEFLQSGHINLLIGSGCSAGYISTLGDIEEKMSHRNKGVRENAKKEYYSLIQKSKTILDESPGKGKKQLMNTKSDYDLLLKFLEKIISDRYLHIVNKQVNIFTTNFDMFLEDSCERLGIPYNDGFMGRISPNFSSANFNKTQKYKSLHFDNTSDIPLFNIIKLHGSISWFIPEGEEKILYSDGKHIPNDLSEKSGDEFEKGYKKIAVINPTAEKHIETVLDANYASMLRKFTLELEKENSILIILGFSLKDKHIKDLLHGVTKSNPTLIVIYFSHSAKIPNDLQKEEFENSNFYIISKKEKFSFKKQSQCMEEMFKEQNNE